VHQAAVLQHGQVEAAAVPGHELWRVLLDAVVEATDQLAFALVRAAERPAAERFVVAQRAGDRDHAMQVQGQEVVAGPGAPLAERELGDVAVGNARVDVVQQAQAGYVRHRLDVECEDRRHSGAARAAGFQSGNTPVER